MILAAATSATFAFAQTAAVTTGVQTYTGDVVASRHKARPSPSRAAPTSRQSPTLTRRKPNLWTRRQCRELRSIHDNTPVKVEYVVDGGVRRVSRVVVQPVATMTTTEETTTTTTTKDDD